jgi:branched-subunit amino acid aminotransferase/4-amino-4-deoxychorismate lyase
MKTIFLDGQYFKIDDQIIDAYAPGVIKAEGVFETMLGLDGVVLDPALHLKRLRSGLKVLGIKAPPIDPLTLKVVLLRNHLSCGRVRLMVWQAGRQTHVMIAALPYKVPNKKIYRVCLIKTGRGANDRLADLKSLDYGLFAEAFSRARSFGFDEALLLNRSGQIFEASRANIFWIKDKILYTPPLSSGCLNGITRQQVIKNARNLRITVKEEALTPKVLTNANAAFLTNSLLGIKPIEFVSEYK